MSFWIAQIFALIGYTFLIISFQYNNMKKLMICQMVCSLCFYIQYAHLNALSGMYSQLFGVFQIGLMWLLKEKINKPILYISTIMSCVIALLGYQNIISIFAIAGSTLYTYIFLKGNMKILRYGNILACLFFIVYGIYNLAIVAVIFQIILVISSIVAIYRFDKKRNA